MGVPKTRQQLDQLKFLQEQGYEVPEALVGLVQEAEWKRAGVAEVWKCKCEKYESPVPVQWMSCGKGHRMKRIFPE